MQNFVWIFLILIPVGILWNLWFFGRAYVRRMRNHPFPERKQGGFVFQERRASGNSDTHRFAGASNCLTVSVTKDELLVWGPDVFAAISERYELECRVALGDIESVNRRRKRVVDVRYRLADGAVRTLTLQLKDAGGFVNALAPRDFRRQCVIHLKSARKDWEALAAEIALLIDGAHSNGAWVKASWGSMSVETKDDLDRTHGARADETHHLEVVAHESVGTDEFLDEVVGLLRTLDRAGFDPVPACDFEDELVGWKLG